MSTSHCLRLDILRDICKNFYFVSSPPPISAGRKKWTHPTTWGLIFQEILVRMFTLFPYLPLSLIHKRTWPPGPKKMVEMLVCHLLGQLIFWIKLKSCLNTSSPRLIGLSCSEQNELGHVDNSSVSCEVRYYFASHLWSLEIPVIVLDSYHTTTLAVK